MIDQNLVRDKNRAVLNVDVGALNKYKQEKALHTKVSKLSNEVIDIKTLLASIVDRLDKIEK